MYCCQSGLSRPSCSRICAVSSGVACCPRSAAAGSPGSRWMNANRMIDSPKSTGIAARSRRMMYLITGGSSLLRSSMAPGRKAPGPSDGSGRADRRCGVTGRLAVEPDRVEELGQVARCPEALHVAALAAAGGLELRIGTIGRSLARMSCAWPQCGLRLGVVRRREAGLERRLQLRRAVAELRVRLVAVEVEEVGDRGSCPGRPSRRSSRGGTSGTCRRPSRLR